MKITLYYLWNISVTLNYIYDITMKSLFILIMNTSKYLVDRFDSMGDVNWMKFAKHVPSVNQFHHL